MLIFSMQSNDARVCTIGWFKVPSMIYDECDDLSMELSYDHEFELGTVMCSIGD